MISDEKCSSLSTSMIVSTLTTTLSLSDDEALGPLHHSSNSQRPQPQTASPLQSLIHQRETPPQTAPLKLGLAHGWSHQQPILCFHLHAVLSHQTIHDSKS